MDTANIQRTAKSFADSDLRPDLPGIRETKSAANVSANGQSTVTAPSSSPPTSIERRSNIDQLTARTRIDHKSCSGIIAAIGLSQQAASKIATNSYISLLTL